MSGLTNNFTWTPPTLHVGVDIKGYASARLQVLVYGVVGPYGDVGPYLKLEADTSTTPWWQLYGGLEVPVGVRVDLLGHKEIASYEVLPSARNSDCPGSGAPRRAHLTPTPTRTRTDPHPHHPQLPRQPRQVRHAAPHRRHGPRPRRHVPDGLRPGAQRRLLRATPTSCRCTRSTWTRTASTGRR